MLFYFSKHVPYARHSSGDTDVSKMENVPAYSAVLVV